MEQKELTAQEIVERLIDEKKISGKEAVILLNEVRIEKEHTPYIPNIVSWGQENAPKCYEPGGFCTNPHMDCINCPQPKAKLTRLDENIIKAAVAFVEQNDHFNCWGGIDKHTVIKALRSLKSHQKSAEWSKEE